MERDCMYCVSSETFPHLNGVWACIVLLRFSWLSSLATPVTRCWFKVIHHFWIPREWRERDSEQRAAPSAKVRVLGRGWSLRPDLMPLIISAPLSSCANTVEPKHSLWSHLPFEFIPNKWFFLYGWGVVKFFPPPILFNAFSRNLAQNKWLVEACWKKWRFFFLTKE